MLHHTNRSGSFAVVAALLFALVTLPACRNSVEAPIAEGSAAPTATPEGSAAAAPAPTVADELPAPVPATMALAEQMASVAREIRSAPDNAAAVLDRAGLTTAQLESNLFAIAADPRAATLYTQLLEAP